MMCCLTNEIGFLCVESIRVGKDWIPAPLYSTLPMRYGIYQGNVGLTSTENSTCRGLGQKRHQEQDRVSVPPVPWEVLGA